MKTKFKSGYVTIIGHPNVGKSTLLNVLLNRKISIVTPKPQTTRQRILGILSSEEYQIIFLDTPGILKPRYQLHRFMLEEIEKSLNDADLVILMIEANNPEKTDRKILKEILPSQKNLFLVINKIDKIAKLDLLPLIDEWKDYFNFQEIIPISALNRDGVDLLLKNILKFIPEGQPFYPPDMVAEQPGRFFVAELIRETIFEWMQQEIPYSTAVLVDPFQSRGKKLFIRAEIIVERPTQRAILIGKEGASLKQIGTIARQKIEEFLKQEIFLELWIRVSKNWKKDFKQLAKLGYKGD